MTDKFTLYSYFRSSCSWRVRIALEWKGLPYEIIPVNLLKGEQNNADFKRINPMTQVPALVLPNGQLLTQSVAIIEYLEEAYPQRPLLPQKDALLRALVRQIMEIIGSGIQPLQNLSTINKVSDDANVKKEFASHWIKKGFHALEELLESTAGKYCVGNEMTLADLFLVPQVTNAQRFEVSLEDFPTIKRINEKLSALPEFQRAHMKAQIDCPPELR